MIRTLVVLALMLAAGCSSNEQAASGDGATRFCTEEKALGSHITKKNCRTVKQIESEERAAAEVLRGETVTSEN